MSTKEMVSEQNLRNVIENTLAERWHYKDILPNVGPLEKADLPRQNWKEFSYGVSSSNSLSTPEQENECLELIQTIINELASRYDVKWS